MISNNSNTSRVSVVIKLDNQQKVFPTPPGTCKTPKEQYWHVTSEVSTWASNYGPRSITLEKKEMEVFPKAFQILWNFHFEKKTTFLSVTQKR